MVQFGLVGERPPVSTASGSNQPPVSTEPLVSAGPPASTVPLVSLGPTVSVLPVSPGPPVSLQPLEGTFDMDALVRHSHHLMHFLRYTCNGEWTPLEVAAVATGLSHERIEELCALSTKNGMPRFVYRVSPEGTAEVCSRRGPKRPRPCW